MFASESQLKESKTENALCIDDMETVNFNLKKEIIFAPLLSLFSLLKRRKISLEEIDLIEISEQFTGQIIICKKILSNPHLIKENLILKR